MIHHIECDLPSKLDTTHKFKVFPFHLQLSLDYYWSEFFLHFVLFFLVWDRSYLSYCDWWKLGIRKDWSMEFLHMFLPKVSARSSANIFNPPVSVNNAISSKYEKFIIHSRSILFPGRANDFYDPYLGLCHRIRLWIVIFLQINWRWFPFMIGSLAIIFLPLPTFSVLLISLFSIFLPGSFDHCSHFYSKVHLSQCYCFWFTKIYLIFNGFLPFSYHFDCYSEEWFSILSVSQWCCWWLMKNNFGSIYFCYELTVRFFSPFNTFAKS